MSQPNYVAHVSKRGSEFLVNVEELEHINFVSHNETDMRAQARHWISELEAIGKDSFTITYEFTDVPSQRIQHRTVQQSESTLPEA